MRIQNNNRIREPTRVTRTSRRRRVVLELDLYSVKSSTKASPESTSHHARNLRLTTWNLGCGNIVSHRKIFIYVPYAITALEIFSDCVGSMGIWFLLTGIFVSRLFLGCFKQGNIMIRLRISWHWLRLINEALWTIQDGVAVIFEYCEQIQLLSQWCLRFAFDFLSPMYYKNKNNFTREIFWIIATEMDTCI